MRWLVNSNGQTSGPMEEAMVFTLVGSGQIGRDAVLRRETESTWLPISETPFAMNIARSTTVAQQTPGISPAGQKVAVWTGAFGVVVAFAAILLATRHKDDPPPPLPTVPAASAMLPSPSPTQIAVPYLAKSDAAWATFDELPKAERTKSRFNETVNLQELILDQVPNDARSLVADRMLKAARQHISAWSSVGASFAGDDARDLVPSVNKAACLMWGSMWVNDVETLAAIMTMGFQRVVCSTKTWVLKEEISHCFLWSIDPDDRTKAPAIVWSTLELYQRSLIIGKRTDENGPLAYMGLMSNGGASTMVAGVKAAILDSGAGWFHVAGDNFSGYVPVELCHHTATK